MNSKRLLIPSDLQLFHGMTHQQWLNYSVTGDGALFGGH